MNRIILSFKCEGNEKHSPHTTPIVMILISNEKEDPEFIDFLEASLQVTDEKGLSREVAIPKESILEVVNDIKNVLKSKVPEDPNADAFNNVSEVDVNVEF